MVAFKPETNPEQFRLEGAEKPLALMGLQAALGIRNGDMKTVNAPIKKGDVRPAVYKAIMGWEPIIIKSKSGYPETLELGWLLTEQVPVVAEAIQQGIEYVETKKSPYQKEYPEIGKQALQSLAILFQPETTIGQDPAAPSC